MRVGERQSAGVSESAGEKSEGKTSSASPDNPLGESAFLPRAPAVDPGRAGVIAYQIKAKFSPSRGSAQRSTSPPGQDGLGGGETSGVVPTGQDDNVTVTVAVTGPRGDAARGGLRGRTSLDLSGVSIDPKTKTGKIFYEFDTFMVIELADGARLPGLMFQGKFIHHDPVEVVDYESYVFDQQTGQWAEDVGLFGSFGRSDSGSVSLHSGDSGSAPAFDERLTLSKMSWEAPKHEGSNPGGCYRDRAGQVWLVKGSHDRAHQDMRARNEVLAAELMRAAGISVPEIRLIRLGSEHGGGLGVASKLVHNLMGISKVDEAAFAQLRDQFAVHAWLANHDVIGMNYDNVMWDRDQVMAVDVGGALLFRARGLPKVNDAGQPGLLDEAVSEFHTMRSGNEQQQKVFGGSRHQTQLAKSAERLKNVSDEDIRDLVNRVGPGDQGFKNRLAANLIQRKQSVLQQAEAELSPAATIPRSPSPFAGAAGKFEPLPMATPARLQKNKRVGYFLHLGRVDLEHPNLAVTTRKGNVWAEKFSEWYRQASDALWAIDWDTLQVLEAYTRFHGRGAHEINAALRAGDHDTPLRETARQVGDYDLTARKVVEKLDAVRVPVPRGAYFTRGIGNHGAGQAVSEGAIAELLQRLQEVQPGTVLQELGFGSTALGNRNSKFRNNEILLELTAADGVSAIPWFARKPEESEVIFPPGQRIAVTDTPHFVTLPNGTQQLVVRAVLLPNA